MATKVSRQTGNWNTTTTWGTITNESILATSTANTTLTSSFQYGAVFTANSTSDSLEKMLVPIDTISSYVLPGDDFDLTVNLEEFNGTTWSQVASVVVNSVTDMTYIDDAWRYPGWFPVELATPYTYTTTTAGYYRMGIKKVENLGAATFRVNTVSSAVAILAVDDRTGVPAATDNAFIIGNYIEDDIHTVTVDGVRSIGDGTNGGTFDSDTPEGPGILITFNGKLAFDPAQNTSLEVDGDITLRTLGIFEMGTSATPIGSAYTANLIFNTLTYDRWFNIYRGGAMNIFATHPHLTTTTFRGVVDSGDGSTGDPLIMTTAVDWAVGDEVVFADVTGTVSTSGDQFEIKFIRVKNSSTSYTLADTAGGAESAFTYSHDTADAHNFNRNVTVQRKSGSTTKYIQMDLDPIRTQGVEFKFSWIGFEGLYYGIDFGASVDTHVSPSDMQFDYLVSRLYNQNATKLTGGFAAPVTFNGCYFGNPFNTSSVGAIYLTNANNFEFNNCSIIGEYDTAINFININSDVTFNSLIVNSCNRDLSAAGTMKFPGVYNITFNSSDFYTNPRTFYLNAGAGSNVVLNQCNIDVKGIVSYLNDAAGISGNADSVVTMSFNDCNYGDSPLTNSLTTRSPIGFQNVDGLANANIVQSGAGDITTTGTGLTDTTVRNGSYAAKFEPATNSTLKYSFKVVAFAGKSVSCIGYAKRNSSYLTGAVMFRLFLPGAAAASATAVLSTGTTDWELWSLVADYTGTTDRLATIEVAIPYQGASNALYLDDILNGNNSITALDLWDLGFPSPIMTNTLGNPAEVWDVANAGFAAGTMGELVDNTKTQVINTQAIAATKT